MRWTRLLEVALLLVAISAAVVFLQREGRTPDHAEPASVEAPDDEPGAAYPWPDRSQRTVDIGGKYFRVDSSSVFVVDSATGTSRQLKPPIELPRLSWVTGITYDSKRGRVLVSTLGGEGFLYAIEPAKETWSLVCSLDGVDLGTLHYFPETDTVYAIDFLEGEDTLVRRLFRLSPDGRVSTLDLSEGIFLPREDAVELRSDQGTLVLEVDGSTYTIDPGDGSVLSMTERQTQPSEPRASDWTAQPSGVELKIEPGKELHVVGVYEAASDDTTGYRPDITVDVVRAGAPFTLVLTSYEPVIWNLNVDQNSSLSSLLVNGYHSQAVRGLPPGVPVQVVTYEDDGDYLDFAGVCKQDSAEYHRMAMELDSLLGLPVTSFQGDYTGKHFLVK